MKKIIIGILGLILTVSCGKKNNHFFMVSGTDDTSYLADVKGCPKIHTRNKDFRVIQSEASKKLFEIKSTGYDGYCYYDSKLEKYKAVIKPSFQITRLEDSDVTDIHFSYYLETVEGPANFIGKKTFFETVTMTRGAPLLNYVGKAQEIIIPEPGTHNNDIYLGIYSRKIDSESKN